MASLAGRVSAAAGAFFHAHSSTVNEKWIGYSALCFPKSTLPAPILAWTLESETTLRSSSPFELLRRNSVSGHGTLQSQPTPEPTCLWRIGLPGGKVSGEFVTRAAAQLRNRSESEPRRSFRDPGIVSIVASREDDDAATATVEESTAAIQHRKVREASVAARSLLFTWSLLSVITTIAMCGIRRVHGMWTRGHETLKPRWERLRTQYEPVRYWASVSCFLCLWLAVAFFLHWQVQRWEMSTMVIADPQAVSDAGFDPGGSFCHSLWPNTGLGCQLSFTQTVYTQTSFI